MLPLHVITIATSVVLPALVAARGAPQFGRLIGQTASILVALSFGFWLLLARFGSSAVDLLYAGKYTETSDLLLLIGLLPIVGTPLIIKPAA